MFFKNRRVVEILRHLLNLSKSNITDTNIKVKAHRPISVKNQSVD